MDSSWGTDGKLITDLGDNRDDDASGMLLQPDGKIVVVGTASNGANGDFALVRYSEDAPWLQTAPAAGSYTVTLGSGDELDDLAAHSGEDLANIRKPRNLYT